jgi:hypothetical protein
MSLAAMMHLAEGILISLMILVRNYAIFCISAQLKERKMEDQE